MCTRSNLAIEKCKPNQIRNLDDVAWKPAPDEMPTQIPEEGDFVGHQGREDLGQVSVDSHNTSQPWRTHHGHNTDHNLLMNPYAQNGENKDFYATPDHGYDQDHGLAMKYSMLKGKDGHLKSECCHSHDTHNDQTVTSHRDCNPHHGTTAKSSEVQNQNSSNHHGQDENHSLAIIATKLQNQPVLKSIRHSQHSNHPLEHYLGIISSSMVQTC